MSEKQPVDTEKDAADYNWVAKAIEGMSERQCWIMYQTLFFRGLRIERAQHEIAKLVPRKVG